jgi:iron complex outermembrane receptor protein
VLIPAALASDLDKVSLFNIQAQSLGSALLQFGAQAHVQISFASDSSIARLQTRGIKGTYSGKQALAKLLKDTDLRYVTHKQTVAILPKQSTRVSIRDYGSASSLSREASVAKYAKEAGTDSSNSHPKRKQAALNEVVVTGSRIPAASNYGAQEVQIYNQEQIDESGQTSIGNFLSTLPDASVSADDETELGEYSTVRLRGLPAGTTLVLLDGRRLENSGAFTGGAFFNLDEIPLAAVQKIEVDPNGASAIYGSDAIAGVVNIILKQDFNGFAAQAKYDWGKDLNNIHTSVAAGKQWTRGGVSLIGSYDQEGGFLASSRYLTGSNNYTALGGPDSNLPVCFPGNVFSLTGAPLPGAPAGSSATYAAVTGTSSSGVPSFSNFAYGTLNQCSLLSGYSILPSKKTEGVLADGHFEVTTDIELFSELLYSHSSLTDAFGHEFLFGIPGYQQYTVSAQNPYNPFGEAVGVATLLPSVPSAELVTTDFFRPLVGIRGTVADRWQWEISGWQSSDQSRVTTTNALPNAIAIQNALDASSPSMALNPFGDGPVGSTADLASLFGNTDVKFMGKDQSAEAFIRGSVLQLPAGSVDAVIGGDYVRSTLYTNEINDGVEPLDTRVNYTRQYQAVFGETRIPVVGALWHATKPILTLTVAGRHDHYSDFGSANTDQIGVEVRPISDILLRWNRATAFEAPDLSDLYSAKADYQTLIADPATGASVDVPVVYGGNARLKPITGQSQSGGVAYSGHDIPGLLISVTEWNVKESNVIQTVLPQVIVDNAEYFSGRVARNSAGLISGVDDTEINFGSIDVAGVDFAVNYQRRLWRGAWSIELDTTDTYHYRQAIAPGAPPVEAVSTAEDDGNWAPRWKGVAGIGWRQSEISLHLDGRYTSAYLDYDSMRRIGNFWLCDSNVRWSLGKAFGRAKWLRRSYLELGATNLFNRGPQFSNYNSDSLGYDAAQMSIVGRTVYASFGVDY